MLLLLLTIVMANDRKQRIHWCLSLRRVMRMLTSVGCHSGDDSRLKPPPEVGFDVIPTDFHALPLSQRVVRAACLHLASCLRGPAGAT